MSEKSSVKSEWSQGEHKTKDNMCSSATPLPLAPHLLFGTKSTERTETVQPTNLNFHISSLKHYKCNTQPSGFYTFVRPIVTASMCVFMIKKKIEQTDTVLVNTEYFLFNQETKGGSSVSCSGNPKAIEQKKRKNSSYAWYYYWCSRRPRRDYLSIQNDLIFTHKHYLLKYWKSLVLVAFSV